MNHQINKLTNLALDYAEFAKKARLPLNTITALSTGIGVHPPKWAQHVGIIIQVWLGENYNTCAVYLGSVEIRLYSGIISMPFDIKDEKLAEIYDKALHYLNNYLNNEALIKEISEETNEQIKKQIEQLKKQLL